MGQNIFDYVFVSSRESFINNLLYFFPYNILDNISFNNINLLIVGGSAANRSISFSLGLYSKTGSTLSLANSASYSETNNLSGLNAKYISITNTSATQNITPGTWYFGLIEVSGGNSRISLVKQNQINPLNSFPGGFIGGIMSVTTGALPNSYAISDLTVTGSAALTYPLIILTA